MPITTENNLYGYDLLEGQVPTRDDAKSVNTITQIPRNRCFLTKRCLVPIKQYCFFFFLLENV